MSQRRRAVRDQRVILFVFCEPDAGVGRPSEFADDLVLATFEVLKDLAQLEGYVTYWTAMLHAQHVGLLVAGELRWVGSVILIVDRGPLSIGLRAVR